MFEYVFWLIRQRGSVSKNKEQSLSACNDFVWRTQIVCFIITVYFEIYAWALWLTLQQWKSYKNKSWVLNDNYRDKILTTRTNKRCELRKYNKTYCIIMFCVQNTLQDNFDDDFWETLSQKRVRFQKLLTRTNTEENSVQRFVYFLNIVRCILDVGRLLSWLLT